MGGKLLWNGLTLIVALPLLPIIEPVTMPLDTVLPASVAVLCRVFPAVVAFELQTANAVNGYGARGQWSAKVSVLVAQCHLCGGDAITAVSDLRPDAPPVCRHRWRPGVRVVADATADDMAGALAGLVAGTDAFLELAGFGDTALARRIELERTTT